NDFAAISFIGSYPFGATRTMTNVSYPLPLSQIAPSPLPFQVGLIPPYGSSFRLFDPNLKLPYTLQWNLALEQSLGKSQAVTVSYVGAAGRRLLQQAVLNLSVINPKFTTVALTRNLATSDYDALQTQFQRRLSRGLQALVSWTWSHALDDDSGSNTLRAAKHGNANFDVRHVFAAAAPYDIPEPSGNSLARAIVGHWSIDSSVHAQSGLPVDLVAATVTNPADGLLLNVRPNVIEGVPFYLSGPQYPGGRTLNNTVPTAAQIAAAGCNPTGPAKGAFCTPPSGQSGNFGRNQVRGLGAWQIDAAL